MTPPCPNFHPSQLPQQIQFRIDGRKRKTEGGKDIDLKACELLGLLQYDCSVEHPQRQDSSVMCYPVQRWFRSHRRARYGSEFRKDVCPTKYLQILL
ncbi:hypothetical protein INS49_012575 [Diaporthe citri]|uniref:uncharacterized protein n=1 Tax=Diaporthe citri TaxID=83186 RepID=UPI001C81FBA3|nr:uncharacterized protein INS49_012575 [Diaporthe citri]KAG6359055.1 hypothetical protein INS49_012575 [Diaporthe citri]